MTTKLLKNLMKGKKEPPRKHTAKLLEHLGAFSFNLKFKSEKEMLVSDALYWLQIDENPNIHDEISLHLLKYEPINENIQVH